MNICVLVKQVNDPEARVEAQEGAVAAEVEKKYMLNFFDSIAVEAALKIREKTGGKITAVSVGPDRVVEALRTAIAMGCDRAVRIWDSILESADHLGIARAIAAFLKKEPADLVLAGRVATDDETGAVGSMVAGFLNIPHAAGAVEIALIENGVSCTTRVEDSEYVFQLPLPALVTVEKGLYVPRVPQVMGVMKAMKVTPELLGLQAIGLSAVDVKPLVKVAAFHPPKARPPVRMVEGEPADAAGKLARILREDAKII
jgi:electron transfer flavoprotein beta subunit